MRPLLIGWLALICAAAPAAADIYQSALIFGTGYAAGPASWDPWIHDPAIGDQLWIVGPVIQVGAPLTGHTLPPVYELTYAYTAFECTGYGMWDDFEHGIGGPFTVWESGTFRVYLDDTPDANFAVPSTFQDGEIVLEGSPGDLFLWSGDPSESQSMSVHFTGGTWFEDVSSDGAGWLANTHGLFGGEVPPAMALLGYIGESTISYMDVISPVAVEATTWGKIKSLYR